jgi:hypothetical protein
MRIRNAVRAAGRAVTMMLAALESAGLLLLVTLSIAAFSGI